MKPLVRASLCVLLLTLTALSVPATGASADTIDQCYGTRIEKKDLTNPDGTKKGYVELWYSSRDGGTNCVMTYNDTPGCNLVTNAYLTVEGRARQSDEGMFCIYAGGVRAKNTNGKCVQFSGYVGLSNGSKGWRYSSGWVHCG